VILFFLEENMKRKQIVKGLVAVIVLLAVLLSTGCAPQTEQTQAQVVATEAVTEAVTQTEAQVIETVYPLVFVDGAERQVEFETEPQRIVSIAPSVTEILFAIGAGDKVVGRTDFCLYPEDVSGVDSIGTLRSPNIESIVALNPDVVIAATHFKQEVLDQLESLGIKVVMLVAQENFEGVYKTIEAAGLLVNRQDGASALIAEMKLEVGAVLEAVKSVDPISVYYVVGFGDSEWTATGDTFIHDMLTMAGGDNAAKDGEFWSYSLEKLIEHDPTIILVSDKYDSLSGFTTHENYQELSAVKEARVLEIDSDLLSIQGPRLAKGLRAIAQLLHPDRF